MLEQLTCSGCGGWLPDTTDPDYAALVDQAKCYGCQSLSIVQRDAQHAHEHDPRPSPGRPEWSDGLRFGVRPATEAEKSRSFRPE